MANQITKFKNGDDFKLILAKEYMTQIQNFFSNKQQAMKFLSSVMSAVQRLPALLDTEPATLINSFMTMAQLGLMPSDVSGEAYVLPYKGKAQFQLGYQGLVTLFFRAGGQKIRAEIIRENDDFSFVNGEVRHTIDIFKSNKERGKAVGAYAIATVNGQEIAKAMNKEDIMAFGKKFSKSFSSEYSPWHEANDPEGMMWKKTVLKQLGKLLPKNETINRALAADNQDSIISDRMPEAEKDVAKLSMGSVIMDEEKEETPPPAPPVVKKAEVKETKAEIAESPIKKTMREAAEKAKGGLL